VLRLRVAWRADSMRALFDEADDDDCLGRPIVWMREHGCPWELSRFYKKPRDYYDLVPTLERLGLRFDAATLRDLLRRVPRQPNLWAPAVAIVRIKPELASVELPIAALSLTKDDLITALELFSDADGRLWEAAALQQCYAGLDHLHALQHTWKTRAPIDWSRLCDAVDWRWLHDAGSPCRQRHSARR
jgi:hypothetical protein